MGAGSVAYEEISVYVGVGRGGGDLDDYLDAHGFDKRGRGWPMMINSIYMREGGEPVL